jgi:hypothetical protein
MKDECSTNDVQINTPARSANIQQKSGRHGSWMFAHEEP